MSLFHSEFVQPFPAIEQSPEILLREVCFIIMHGTLFFNLTFLLCDMRGRCNGKKWKITEGPTIKFVGSFFLEFCTRSLVIVVL